MGETSGPGEERTRDMTDEVDLRPSRSEAPTVSVIVPVHNDAERLGRCLRLLAQQDYPRDRFEVVVVDNASTEDLRPALPPGDERFRVEHEARRGSYAARNKGVVSSEGDVLAFTDGDCLPRPGWLSAGVEALTRAPAPDAVGGAINLVFRGGREPRSAPEHMDAMEGLPQEHSIATYPFAMTANLLVRRETFDRVGPFDAGLKSGGDLDWGLRLDATGGSFRYAADAVVDHPSRPTWGELTHKSVRVAGGVADLEANRPAREVLRGVGGELWDALAFWKVVWTLDRPRRWTSRVALAAAFGYVRVLRSGVRLSRLVRRGRGRCRAGG